MDDEPAVRSIMARWLTGAAETVRTAGSADEALEALTADERCDVAVIDVRMPGHDGVWLKNELHRRRPHTAVVLATAYTDLLARAGATEKVADLLVKPFARDRFLLAVDRGRRWRKEALDDSRWHLQLSAEIGDRVAAIRTSLERAAAEDTSELDALTAAVLDRAPAVVAHSDRVRHLACAIARGLNSDAAPLDLVDLVARVHDIGKAAMPEPLLTKPSPYTANEATMMRRHVDIGAQLLAATRTLAHTAGFVLASHEWYGGGGYPRNLAGSDIPLVCRILAVADAYDAMTEPRDYRPRLDARDAADELLRCSGTQFDPAVVIALLTVQGDADPGSRA